MELRVREGARERTVDRVGSRLERESGRTYGQGKSVLAGGADRCWGRDVTTRDDDEDRTRAADSVIHRRVCISRAISQNDRPTGQWTAVVEVDYQCERGDHPECDYPSVGPRALPDTHTLV